MAAARDERRTADVIAIIDDDPSVRRSLGRLLAVSGLDGRLFASAAEFLRSPDCGDVACIVSDLRMPGIGGLELQDGIRKRLPNVAIVFITGHGNVPSSVAAMKAGAVDFLEKPVSRDVLLGAIDRAIGMTRDLRARSTEIAALRRKYETLTPREREVFALVSAGLLNKQVGAELGAAEKTIKQHRGRVMEKMDADSLADLVRMAEKLDIATTTDFSKAKGRVPAA